MTTTVKAISNQALSMLGYTEKNGNERFTSRVMNKVVPIFNMVYEDIWNIEEDSEFQHVNTMSDVITMRDRAIEVITYGLAAFLAQSEGDTDNQSIWMNIYNNKRAGLSSVEVVQDVLPLGEG